MSFLYGVYLCVLGCLYKYAPHRRSPAPNLATIPSELQYVVLEYLDWDDILVVRQVCKGLHDTSKARHVWLHLFHHYSATVFPKPFPLPRPLQHCTAAELERATCEYLHSLRCLPRHIKRVRRFTAPHPAWQSYLLPGGRWVLMANRDGSLSFVDCATETFEVYPLTPPPWGVGVGNVHLSISMDIHDDSETLAFNIALLLCRKESDIYKQEVQVWSVAVEFDDSWSALGLSATLLSTFPEDPRRDFGECSLYGEYVAYRIGNTISVVNWQEANGPSAQFPRRVLQSCIGNFHLTSHGRLLTHYSGLTRLFDIACAPVLWESISFAFPQENTASCWRRDSTRVAVESVWLKRFSKAQNDVFIFPTKDEYEGLSIPSTYSSEGSQPEPSICNLGPSGKHAKYHYFAPATLSYDHSVSLVDHGLCFFRFSWSGADKTGTESFIALDMPDCPPFHGAAHVDLVPTRILFSDWAGDFVYFDLV